MDVIKRGKYLHFDVQIDSKRYRFPVNNFVLPRLAAGQKPPKTVREVEHVWLSELVAAVKRGEDPKKPPPRAGTNLSTLTIDEFFDKHYLPLYVQSADLKRPDVIVDNVRVLRPVLGHLLVAALENAEAYDLVVARYPRTRFALATKNTMLARVKHMTRWAYSRKLIASNPWFRGGLSIDKRMEVQRTERRITDAEIAALKDAAKNYERSGTGNRVLTWDKVTNIRERAKTEKLVDIAGDTKLSRGLVSQIVSHRIWKETPPSGSTLYEQIVCALTTGCRRGEMLKIQNRHFDWTKSAVFLPKENTKGKKGRWIPVQRGSELYRFFEARRFVGGLDGFVFGTEAGKYQPFSRKIWEAIVLTAYGKPVIRMRATGKNHLSEASRLAFAGIDLHWHDLRHECATRWYEQSKDVSLVQRLLGHQSLMMTQRYLNVDDSDTTRALEALWAKSGTE